ncbi:hypothetical protein [Bacillus sp. P14.5]|uniref:hypothetical protein n=1 Tax=Bacillus sp. P14.5 TaxID=1983400 RepID=UPI000DEBD6DE|nr:hypothetical protein [Bacillus sp. P14.5]
MKEFRESLKYAGIILGVSMLIFLAAGYADGSYNWNTFYIFFMGAVFGNCVGLMRNKQNFSGTLKRNLK